MGGKRVGRESGSRLGITLTFKHTTMEGYHKARCEYCRGWVADGDHRAVLVAGEKKFVHRRHPRREGEQTPEE